LKAALGHYEKALKVHPGETHILYNIGRLHLDLKEPETGKSFFVKALEVDPDFKEAQEVLSAIELGTI
jgi:Tfp pilus assembly protein PilF